MAFIALDSENLGEHVDDAFHYDFGDNMFPHFMGNKTSADDNASKAQDEEEDNAAIDEAYRETGSLTEEELQSLVKYIPKSVLLFLTK